MLAVAQIGTVDTLPKQIANFKLFPTLQSFGATEALHKKSVGAVSDRDSGLPHLPKCEVALNRRRRRLPQNDF